VGSKKGRNRSFVSIHLYPSFQYSTIPISQLGCSTWSKASQIPYAQQVTEILPLRIVSGTRVALFMEDGEEERRGTKNVPGKTWLRPSVKGSRKGPRDR